MIQLLYQKEYHEFKEQKKQDFKCLEYPNICVKSHICYLI